MTTIKAKRTGRLTASILMLLAAAAPAATPALAQTLDLQSAAMAEGAGDDDVQPTDAVVQPAFSNDAPQQQGDDFYCGQRKLGQWFYCERPKAKPSAPQASAQPQQSSTAQLKAITKQLDELKARAILEPTEANVIAYVRYQREQLDRASTFSDTWQRALWQNPDIDYTLQRPVSTVGKRAWTDNRSATRDQVLSRLGQRYGMFYFFAQSCAACEVFSPILRSVADSHRITVMAVSTDGGPSRQFPNYVVDSGQRQRMGVPLATPALVLFDTVTRKTVPVGFGVMSADEVMERIFMLTNSKVGSDF
ncbi:conjugal transfer protein TraF [Sphingomonas sp. 2R-10]|uniref:conjugal transfer protein TraF n=1 Tax=Sphingomonas sp. 2R-10 TaxID=3045148 RepID=UPI0024B9A29A|nr:conjugal transfer protein TraF [Sphingomonas sp. 2R-10]MDJ0277646.1 conjugal transfer protein TraF [Sphingomonas sp. 2R-10]